MPEIKVKHVVSFSSEDTVYKAENLLKPETFRKWKCATPGEKRASVLLQFEKASQIQSIDIGNDHSAFVEVLAGRSSDSNQDYQVLLTASSFMSPLESRNGTNINRVRMFGSEKFSQNVKNEKWDYIQIICTQPFNKNVQYGLSFVKFHSVPNPAEEAAKEKKQNELKLGAFKLKDDDDDELPVGNWFSKRNEKQKLSVTSPSAIRQATFPVGVSETNSSSPSSSKQYPSAKRKLDDDGETLPAKKKESTIARVNREKVGHKHINEDDDATQKLLPVAAKHGNEPVSNSPPITKKLPVAAKRGNEKIIDSPPVTKKLLTANKVEHKDKKKKKSPNRIMEKVVFVISGFQNPHRGEIRDRASEMGAKYKGDWDSSCTHLICAFVNTPKYNLVRAKGGRIVTKNWIYDCYKKKELLPWRKYMLGQYSKSTTEEEMDSSDNEIAKICDKNKEHTESKPASKQNGSASSSSDKAVSSSDKDVSSSLRKEDKAPNKLAEKAITAHNDENDDDDSNAEIDYLADTDVDSSSGGDTEDEIRKVEQNIQKLKTDMKKDKSPRKKDKSPRKTNGDILDTALDDDSLSGKPNTKDLPLPILPDFFKGRKFLMYGDFPDQEKHKLERFITAYNGCRVDYMSDDVKYVVTLSKWSSDFDDALSENADLIFVRPQWIYKCHEKGKFIPFQPHIVIPDS